MSGCTIRNCWFQTNLVGYSKHWNCCWLSNMIQVKSLFDMTSAWHWRGRYVLNIEKLLQNTFHKVNIIYSETWGFLFVARQAIFVPFSIWQIIPWSLFLIDFQFVLSIRYVIQMKKLLWNVEMSPTVKLTQLYSSFLTFLSLERKRQDQQKQVRACTREGDINEYLTYLKPGFSEPFTFFASVRVEKTYL